MGPVARASGLVRDARHDLPTGIYRFAHLPVATCESGDVFARAYVRWLEIQQSIEFIREQIPEIPPGDPRIEPGPLSPSSIAVAINEGWRGEVCHVAITDAQSRFSRYKVVDPSFHNWPALAFVLRRQQISDFPICNKSFKPVLLRPRPVSVSHAIEGEPVLKILLTRLKQGHRTIQYPDGPAPEMPDRFRGLPIIDSAKCADGCRAMRRGLSNPSPRPNRQNAHRSGQVPVLHGLHDSLSQPGDLPQRRLPPCRATPARI